MIKHFTLAASLCALALATAGTAAQAKPVAAKPAAKPAADKTDGWGAAGIQTWYNDTSVKPGDDFNRYVNGKWLDTAEIPADRTSTGGFVVLRDLSETRMKAIFDELLQSNPAPGSDAARVSAAYKAFMDTDAIEKRGLAPLQPHLARIKAATTVAALTELFNEPGVPSPLGLDVSVDGKKSDSYALFARQGGLGLPDRDMYLLDIPRFREFQSAYKKYMTFVFTELGHADPAKDAEAVYALEHKIAEVTWDRALNRNRDLTYNKMSLDAFAALAPDVPLKTMVTAMTGGKANEIIVAQLPPTADEIAAAKLTPAQAANLRGGVPAIARLIASEPIGVWQAWLEKNLVMGTAPMLPRRFDEANFAFFGKLLSGQPEQRPRWKRGIATVEGMAGELVGKIYAQRHFPAANKAAMEKLVANLRAAMAANLSELKWMGPETRVQAKAKLDMFDPKIGYPVKFKTYEGLDFKADDPIGNALAAARWELADDISRLGKPVDRTEWGMLPETVNAYYNSTKNEIVFPAAILQPPFFNLKADDAVNYGAIGAVIGHEMGHGFDDQGAKSDGAGNLRDWWTADDKANFVKLTDALAEQYNGHCPISDPKAPGGKACINGRLTLGENIGDLGGISLAYRAYKLSLKGKKAPVIDGLTGDQRFFMAYAQVFKVKMREAALRQQLLTDPHSPGQFRINGIVRNIDEWYKAFGVKPTDKLYLPPEKRLRIW